MDARKSFFAATGFSNSTEVMVAAAEATDAMMVKFRTAKKTPKAVLFIERVKDFVIPHDQPDKFHLANAIGRTIKDHAGGAKVFGTGGAGVYGITWGRDLKDGDSSFMVMGLTGSDLEVDGYTDAGYFHASAPGDSTLRLAREGHPLGWETIYREKIQRQTCRLHGQYMGRLLPPVLPKPGFIVLMGALHNDYHVTYLEGMKQDFAPKTSMIAGVGHMTDYIYCDGFEMHDRTGAAGPTVNGRLAVTICGSDFDFAVFGGECVNKSDAASIDRHTADVAGRLIERLGGPPQAMIAFSCVTRLRDSKVMDPAMLTAGMIRHFFRGDEKGELFGCFCGGEAALVPDVGFTAGGDRLVAVGMRAK